MHSNNFANYCFNRLNESKPVTNSRDTQEVPTDIGLSMLEAFEKYQNETSILDALDYFDENSANSLNGIDSPDSDNKKKL